MLLQGQPGCFLRYQIVVFNLYFFSVNVGILFFFDGIVSICGLMGVEVSQGLGGYLSFHGMILWVCREFYKDPGALAQAGYDIQFLKYVAYSNTETGGSRRRSAEHDSEVQCVALIGSRHSLHSTTACELRVCRGTHEEKVFAGFCRFSRT